LYCTSCGFQNPDNQANCSNCGAALGSLLQAQRPPNYLVWSIISTVLCCLPAGIVAIIYSAKVDSKFNAGDYAGASQDSDMARKWNIGALVVGGIVNLVYVGLVALGALSGAGG